MTSMTGFSGPVVLRSSVVSVVSLSSRRSSCVSLFVFWDAAPFGIVSTVGSVDFLVSVWCMLRRSSVSWTSVSVVATVVTVGLARWFDLCFVGAGLSSAAADVGRVVVFDRVGA